jgi:hypothetical protein
VIGRATPEEVCDWLGKSLPAIVELGELTSGDFALLIICALVESAAAANVEITSKSANERVLL